MDMAMRPRRLRTSETLRRMVRETRVSKSALIYPTFVVEGQGRQEEIPSMAGQYRYSVDKLLYKAEEMLEAGIDKMMIFGIPDHKDACGSEAYAEHGVVQQAMAALKARFPELYLIGDVCMCEYTAQGHCGILAGDDVDNDKTLPYIARIAVSQAAAGADMVAPSDMMDGRVAAIRSALDEAGFVKTPIFSYAVKYASAFYGPFREAADSAPAFGDRKAYQMDWHNRREAVKEALADVAEGADLLMVKPALAYGDILSEVKAVTDVPVGAYSVSGEYSMIKTCAAHGYVDETAIMCEVAGAAFRAGADVYLTYFAKELARAMEEGRLG